MLIDYKKKTIPQIILSAILGLFFIEYMLPVGPLTVVTTELMLWLQIVSSMTFLVASVTLFLRYSKDLISKEKISFNQLLAWEFFLVFFTYIAVAAFFGGTMGSMYTGLYTMLQGNLSQAVWVLFVFLEPWAAYKAFHLRSIDSIVVAVAGLTYILYVAPSTSIYLPAFGEFANWMITVPSKAGGRGATITMAIGALLIAFRMLTGKEKGILEEEV